MVQITSTFLAVVSCVAFVAAAPFSTKRACTPMTDAELGALPGKNHIESVAVADHGDGSHRLVVNDPDFPGSPANVCDNLATGTVWVEYDDSTDGHFKWAYSMDDILSEDERRVA